MASAAAFSALHNRRRPAFRAPEDLAQIPRISDPETSFGSLADFPNGVAIGREAARALGRLDRIVLALVDPALEDGVLRGEQRGRRLVAGEVLTERERFLERELDDAQSSPDLETAHLDDETLKEMDILMGEGVTSFKLFMAYPGVLYSDDGQILRAMQNASESGAMIMMHAENGIAIDVLVAQALARGETDPMYHSLTRPAELEGEAGVSRILRRAVRSHGGVAIRTLSMISRPSAG